MSKKFVNEVTFGVTSANLKVSDKSCKKEITIKILVSRALSKDFKQTYAVIVKFF